MFVRRLSRYPNMQKPNPVFKLPLCKHTAEAEALQTHSSRHADFQSVPSKLEGTVVNQEPNQPVPT